MVLNRRKQCCSITLPTLKLFRVSPLTRLSSGKAIGLTSNLIQNCTLYISPFEAPRPFANFEATALFNHHEVNPAEVKMLCR